MSEASGAAHESEQAFDHWPLTIARHPTYIGALQE
jgi:hypothetical protein